MATLRNVKNNQVRAVPARMLVGRTPACSLLIDDRHVSGEHASLIWTGKHWEIRDLGSRNGTFVDGDRLEPGSPVRLKRGAKVAFGHEDDPWELVDSGPPSALAEAMGTDELRTASEGILVLPSEESPEVVIYGDQTGKWVVEENDETKRTVHDQEIFVAGGRSWRIRLPASQEGTAAVDTGPSIDNVSLRFAVSMNEEHVEITVIHRGKEIVLEPREHSYTLLTLARARMEERDLPESEQGWVDRDMLLKMLGLDANALNVAIYRARGQLSSVGVTGAANVVEVRRGQRRIGLDPARLEVVPL